MDRPHVTDTLTIARHACASIAVGNGYLDNFVLNAYCFTGEPPTGLGMELST